MGPNDQQFPTLPEAPVSSSVRKARVRAALFHKKVEAVRIGRFILLEQLGAGAMGEIFAAYDGRLDRRVALKLVRQGSALTVKADELLLREAQALAQVSHPNVVQIYEAGTHEGRMFIAMELIPGQTLTRWLAEAAQLSRPQRQREILRRFIAAGRGLEAVHAAGVAHRDFKPDNVLVGDDGRVCVVDFGLARALVSSLAADELRGAAPGKASLGWAGDLMHGETVHMDPAELPVSGNAVTASFATGGATISDKLGPAAPPPLDDHSEAPATDPPKLTAASRLTEPGTIMGTPRYMAPEQIRGALADRKSDQFSFCVALYHALYGVFPFAGDSHKKLLDSMANGPTGLEHGGGVAARVRKALRRGLSVDPSQRFASTSELLAALEPGITRRGRWVASATLLFAAAVAALLWASWGSDPCATAGDEIDSAWSIQRQAAVHAAFLRSDLPYAEAGWLGTSRRITGYATGWRGGAIAACRATYVDHAQSDQQFDRRRLCLERGRRQLSALVSEFATGALDAVQHAVEVAESLPDVRACSHTENILFGLEPPPFAVEHEVAVVRDKLARSNTLQALARTEESLMLARDATVVAERLSYPPLHAEALAQTARALDGRGTAATRDQAQELYLQALGIAEAERHDELAALIWMRLVQLATRMDAGTQQARAWWLRAEAAVRRIGNTSLDRARLHHMLGEIDYRDGKYAEAADEENRAITAISGAPDQDLELSHYYDALAKALEPQGHLEDALRLHEHALRIASDALGSSHPDVIYLKANYGKALEKAGQLVRARAVLDDALASMPEHDRSSHIDAGRLHAFLSDVSYTEGKLDDAAAHATASLQIYQRAGAAAHLLAEAATNLGNVELRRKHFVEALAKYEEALALRGSLDPQHYQIGVNEGSIADALVGLLRFDAALPHVLAAERVFDHGSGRDRGTQAWILTVHGEVLVGQRRPDAAIEVLEKALPLFAGAADPSDEPRALWTLARALHSSRKDPARVRRLAEQAGALFKELGPPEAGNVASVRSFLEQLPPAPASAPPSKR